MPIARKTGSRLLILGKLFFAHHSKNSCFFLDYFSVLTRIYVFWDPIIYNYTKERSPDPNFFVSRLEMFPKITLRFILTSLISDADMCK